MKITRDVSGESAEFELSREELKKAAHAYEKLVAQEAVEKYIKEHKGVISMDAYEGIIKNCVDDYLKERAAGRDMGIALHNAVSHEFYYMERTPSGIVPLNPGFHCRENFESEPERVCFCEAHVDITQKNPGFTGNDFLHAANGDKDLAAALFFLCTEKYTLASPKRLMATEDYREEAMRLASRIKENREAEEKKRDKNAELAIQRGDALGVFQQLNAVYVGNWDEIQLAFGIKHLLECKADSLSPEDASILAQKALLFDRSYHIPYEERLNAVKHILENGFSSEDISLFPSLSMENSISLLLSCPMDAFDFVIEVTVFSHRPEFDEFCNFTPLEDPGMKTLFSEAERIESEGKPSLDSIMQGAREKVAVPPTKAPASEMREL